MSDTTDLTTDPYFGVRVSRGRLTCSAPIRPVIAAVHRDWWNRIGKIVDVNPGGVLAGRTPDRRHSLRAATYALVSELLRGTRTSEDQPVRGFGPLPMTKEIALALIAVLIEWQVPRSVMEAAYAAIRDAV